MTRSLGDRKYKKNKNLPPEEQIVTAFPDLITQQVQCDDEFLVLATDGNICICSSQLTLLRDMGLLQLARSC